MLLKKLRSALRTAMAQREGAEPVEGSWQCKVLCDYDDEGAQAVRFTSLPAWTY